MNKNVFLKVITAVFVVLVFITGCSLSPNLTNEEKAVLVNKAITNAGTTPQSKTLSKTLSAKTISSGTMTVSIGDAADMAGSAFASEVAGSGTWIVSVITYTNVSVTVQDDNGNDVNVTLNGNMKYAMNATASTTTYIFYGTVSGAVDGESYNFEIDLKTEMTLNGDGSFSVTVTGTAGGEAVHETYTKS